MPDITRRAAAVILVSMILALSFGCARRAHNAEWRGRVDTMDGVRIVSNPKDPLYGPAALMLREDLVIGGSGKDLDPTFARAGLEPWSLIMI